MTRGRGEQIARGLRGELLALPQWLRRQGIKSPAQLLGNQHAQARGDAGPEFRSLVRQHAWQPVGPLLQHQDQQILEARPVIIQPPKQQLHRCHQVRIGEGPFEHAPRRRGVQRPGRLGDLEPQSAARGDRQLRRECLAVGIDRHHAQARRRFQQSPVALVVPAQCGRRKRRLEFAPARALARRLQCVQNASAHLQGRLAREGDGEDFLRRIDMGEQRQQAAAQHRGLARTGRRLQQEGATGVERRGARRRIGLQRFLRRQRSRISRHRPALPRIQIPAAAVSPRQCGTGPAGGSPGRRRAVAARWPRQLQIPPPECR